MADVHGITRKYIDWKGWRRRIGRRRLWMCDTYQARFGGCAALIEIDRVSEPLIVALGSRTFCIVDDGYSLLQWLPTDAYWAVAAFFDARGEIIEWYFDMTAGCGVEEGRPYYDDLLLDVVLLPNGETFLLDEDELLEALEAGLIDKGQYDLAYRTAREVVGGIAADPAALAEATYAHRAWMLENVRATEG